MVDEHAILLRGLSLHEADDTRPTLVRRSEIKFLDNLLKDMTEGGDFPRLTTKTINQGVVAPQLNQKVKTKKQGRRLLSDLTDTKTVQQPVKLYQPVHRTFQFVVVDASCDLFPELGQAGQPKLDRDQIESAGLVVRRVNNETGVPDAWLTDGDMLRGWIPMDAGDLNQNMDPDPQRRPRSLGTGIPELDEQLGLDQLPAETLSEAVEPLHVAPPEVCEGADRTLLFGMIPTISLEHSETPDEELVPPRVELGVLRSLFADYLTPGGGTRSVPLTLNPLGVDFFEAKQREKTNGDKFLSLLRWVVELGALDNPAFFDVLNTVTVTLALDPGTAGLNIVSPFELIVERDSQNRVIERYIQVRLGDFVFDAAERLRDSEVDLTSVTTVPSGHFLNWRITNENTSDDALEALGDRIQSRTAEFKLVAGERRFDPRRGRYVARAFIRVRREPGCPPELWWSDYTEVFKIAQHWDSNPDVPPTVVPLPGIPSRETLKAMKPNVAFEVPESLQNFLDANGATDFLEENAKKGSGVGIGILWICSFNIYIIMMIAFVILIIFAILLNIVFNWLIFIRICLPIPVPTEE